MSGPWRLFLIGLVALMIISSLIAAFMHSFRPGDELWGALTGIVACGLSAALSYVLMMSVLKSSNLSWLRAHFAGMILRILLLLMMGILVWKVLNWSVGRYLVAVALTYPFFLFMEAWLLNRSLSDRSRTRATEGP